MNKRIIVAMAALLLSLFANISVQAQDSAQKSGTCGDKITWALSDDGVLTLTGSGAMTDYDTYNNQGPWRWRMDIKKVVVGEGITSIGDYAFLSDSPITEVELPATVETIGIGAFEDLKSTEIQLPASLTTIKERAFEGSSLTSITIPENVTRIEDYAFSNCNLSTFHVPASVTYIGKFLLASGNFNLTSITVDEGNTVYDSRDNCNAIIETSTSTLVEGCKTTIIPSTVTAIGDYAFSSRKEMTSLAIPASVTNIGKEFLSGYKEGIKKELIFEGTKSPNFAIGAFGGMDTKDFIVRVPNSATEEYRVNSPFNTFGDSFRAMSVRTHAEYNNTGETVKIYYDDKAAVAYNWYGCEITKDNFIINDEITESIYKVIGTAIPIYKITAIEFDESIKDYRRTSCNNMFENLTGLKKIKGLEYLNTVNVTSMIRMFYGCTNLETLNLSGFDTKSVTTMNGMFGACENMKHIIVSDKFATDNLKGTNDMFVNNNYLKNKKNTAGKELANYIDGNFEKMVGTIGGEPFGATGNNLTVDNLDLTDGSDFVLTEPAPVTATNVNYSRVMTSKWGTLCLPYPIDPQKDGNNCQYYSIKKITDDAITLEPATSTIEAGTPVIFKRTDDAEAATINGSGLLLAEAKTNGNLVGTFTTLTAPDDAYFIAKDAFRKVSDYKTMMNAVKVNPFRAYIQPTEGQSLSASTLSINMGDATAIDSATMFDAIDNGTAEYYDASGKRTDGLHKGLNIVKANGKTKKVIVK